MSIVDDLKKELSKDDNFESFKNLVNSSSKQLNYDTVYEELMTLHKNRKGRNLHLNGRPSTNDIMDCILQDSSYRSRIIEITVSISRNLQNLNTAIEAIVNYVVTEFANKSLLVIKSRIEREQVVRVIISKVQELLDRHKNLNDFCTYLITDIDKAGYSYKNIVEIFEIMVKERTLGGINTTH